MKTERALGEQLKKLYGDFIGEFNRYNVVGFNTDYNHTRKSTNEVILGLSPVSKMFTSTAQHTGGCDFLSAFECPR